MFVFNIYSQKYNWKTVFYTLSLLQPFIAFFYWLGFNKKFLFLLLASHVAQATPPIEIKGGFCD